MARPLHQGRILAGFHGLELPAQAKELAQSGALAGFILFRRNLAGPAQLKELIKQMHEAFSGQLPPLIGVDQEGGLVQRLREPEFSVRRLPPMGQLHTLSAELFQMLGREVGQGLAAHGFNLDFAPVLDIHTNPANPIIGERAFGTTPEAVIERALPFAQGLSDEGILWCGKHFPGHGDTDLDSHLALPRLSHSKERLNAVELRPFAAAVPHAPLMMSAHIIFEQLCELPATLSPRVIPELLRQELGFDGVVASDDLEMAAIREHYTLEEVAVGLDAATVDLALVCSDLSFAEALAQRLPDNPRAAERIARLRAGLSQIR